MYVMVRHGKETTNKSHFPPGSCSTVRMVELFARNINIIQTIRRTLITLKRTIEAMVCLAWWKVFELGDPLPTLFYGQPSNVYIPFFFIDGASFASFFTIT
jgi:hypothetical protein